MTSPRLSLGRVPRRGGQTALRGTPLLLARAVWISLALLALGLFAANLPVAYGQYLNVCPGDTCPGLRISSLDARALAELGLSPGFYAAYMTALQSFYAVIFCAVGAVVFWRKSDDLAALLVSLTLVLFGLNGLDVLVDTHPGLWLPVALVSLICNVVFLVAFYVFPDGRFVPRWTRWLAVGWLLYQLPNNLFPDSPFSGRSWPILIDASVWLGFLGTIIFAQVYRYRRSSDVVERQQTKWVVFGLTAAISVFISATVPGVVFRGLLEPGVSGMVYLLAAMTATNLAFTLIPISIGVAVLRYRLWDIDLIINRTLVYGALTASLVCIYALAVGGMGTLLQARANLLVSLPAAGLVAALFAPLRERLQRAVNRLMYGERDDPYGVLSRLNRRLGATFEPGAALSTIVETVAGALRLPYAAVAIRRGDGFEVAASRGTSTGDETVLPLSYGGETVGQLLLAPRSPGEEFSPADLSLLEDLARNAEAAVYAAGLTADLRRSRERLVSAREEERRRLRRDLHDGLGPTLASLMLGLDVSLKLMKKDPEEAEEMLSRLKAQTKEAVVDIRRLVYGLRPPALDDLGLVAAIREQAAAHGRLRDGGAVGTGLGFTIEAPDELPALPAAVEVACYRIAQEAITNVASHARATACRVSLSVGDGGRALILEVSDDGVGLPDTDSRRAGVGLSSMRERTEELGGDLSVAAAPEGGTRASARFPLPEPEVPEEPSAEHVAANAERGAR